MDMDLYLSYSQWGMHPCWTYPLREIDYANTFAWPMTYFGDSYDAKYLHG